jgi:hypothetical protein
MRSRRFLLLATFLVALNIALWIVPQGLALQQVVISSLFGKNMVRSEAIVNRGGCPTACADLHADRGVVVSNSPLLNTITLHEADGTVVSIATSSSTKVTALGSTAVFKLRTVKPGWRVLVTWPGPSGPADAIVIEKRHS